MMNGFNLLPRLIRLRDAPNYLGMDRHRFNEEVRPKLMEIPIGSQGVAFDRLDLDAWVDDYIQCSGRPAITRQRSLEQWDEKNRRVSSKEGNIGISINRSLDTEFEKALVLATSKKQKNTLQNGLKK
jgi:predicted DNA-binding transcriptional regulator AlpA